MRTSAACVLLGLMMCVVGCSNQKSWVYAPNSYPSGQAADTRTAVILPFDDGRHNMNSNKIFLSWIPLMPVGWADFDVPEGQMMHLNSGLWVNYKPTEDFAKALAQELTAAQVFKESYFDFRKTNADFAITGKIVSTKYHGSMYTYCLSVYGSILWLIGLPATTTANELQVELTCTDTKTGQTILTRSYEAPRESHTSWIYGLHNDFEYPNMLQGVYKNFVVDLRAALHR